MACIISLPLLQRQTDQSPSMVCNKQRNIQHIIRFQITQRKTHTLLHLVRKQLLEFNKKLTGSIGLDLTSTGKCSEEKLIITCILKCLSASMMAVSLSLGHFGCFALSDFALL